MVIVPWWNAYNDRFPPKKRRAYGVHEIVFNPLNNFNGMVKCFFYPAIKNVPSNWLQWKDTDCMMIDDI